MKSILMDYVLFSLIEGIIFNLFFINIGKLNRIKWWQVPIMAFINCALSCTLPPLVYQPAMILNNALFLIIIPLRFIEIFSLFIYKKNYGE